MYTRLVLLFTLLLGACSDDRISITEYSAISDKERQARVVFLAGRDSHGPGEHEHRAGSELLAAALRERAPRFEIAVVYGGWPDDDAVFEGADALVLYCDGGAKNVINQHLDSFNQLIAKGVGVVSLHYCVEVPKDSAPAQSMLQATGGYFETHWSVNPHWEANFRELPVHEITAGIQPFTMLDEWYFNMRFIPEGITPILSAVAPQETMKRKNGPHSGNDAVRKLVAQHTLQVTAWAYVRENGGRGFGYTGGHFHKNWNHDDARKLVLNAIEWVAEGEQSSNGAIRSVAP